MTAPDPADVFPPDSAAAALRPLAAQVPNVDAAVAEIARLSAELTLPKGTIHVISDVHGEDKKLRHVINNASGTLRPLVERMFAHPAIAYIHLHNAKRGCFSCAVERVSAVGAGALRAAS